MTSIKIFRKRYNMTQQQLANALNVTQGAVNQWEHGSVKPKLENLIRMAQLFGCTVEDLVKKGA